MREQLLPTPEIREGDDGKGEKTSESERPRAENLKFDLYDLAESTEE